jgi:hypothetical protein
MSGRRNALPCENNLGPPKEKPGAVTAPGFDIVRKDAFSYLNPVSLSRDFSDFRTLDAGPEQAQDGARQRRAEGIGMIVGVHTVGPRMRERLQRGAK